MMPHAKKLAIIAAQGTLDSGYPPFILASTAAALGYEARIFFMFHGLQLLRRDLGLKVSPLGNPALRLPFGMHRWFPALVAALPGMETLFTALLKRRLRSKGVASLEELRDLCVESGVKMIACQMTLDLLDVDLKDLIDGVELGGAASFLDFAGGSDICLYM